MTEKTDNLLNEINKKLDLMKLESSKDMEPLKNKNIITLNTNESSFCHYFQVLNNHILIVLYLKQIL